MKNNYIKSERMWNVCLTYVYRMFYVISILFTFGVGQMWGADASSANFYYDNTSSNWSDVQLLIGKSDYSEVYALTKLTNSNQLYYKRSFSWGGYTEFYFTTGASSWGSEGNSPTSRSSWCTNSAKLTTNVGSDTYLFVSSGGNDGSSITTTKLSGYDALNFTQTVQRELTTDGGSSFSATTTNVGTVKVSSYKLASASATSATSNEGTIGSGQSSATCKAVRTANITVDVTAVTTGYHFLGWYVGDDCVSTNQKYSDYWASQAFTFKARFTQNFTVGDVLYLLPNSTWKGASGLKRYVAYFYGAGGDTWASCTQVGSSDYYSVTVPAGNWGYVIFVASNNSDSYGWGYKIFQTDDLMYDSSHNGVEITGSNKSQSRITVYTGISVSRTPTAAANAPTITNSQTVVKSGSSVTINAQNETTGYHWVNWTKTSGTLGNANNKSTTFTPSANSASAVANYAINTYTVSYNANDAQYPGTASGSTTSSSHTYGTAKALTTNGFTRTGYTFAGWATSPTGAVVYSNGQSVTNLTTSHGVTVPLYAKWTAKQSAITFDYQTEVAGYSSSGDITNATGLKGTYGSAMTALTGTMPSAINGYAFMGFYSGIGGTGTKYYNANGTSANNWAEDTESGTTLYAHWKKAEITAITITGGATVEQSHSVTATATISPTPVEPTIICWELQYSNGTPIETTFDPETGASVTFTSPAYSGSYKLQATLRTGSSCSGGTELSTHTINLVVAGNHNVTIRYKCGDKTIRSASSVAAEPLEWSDAITAPNDIFGYTFEKWEAGDGVTITTNDGASTVTETTTATIKIKATYDGDLVAKYTKDNIIYFKNTLNWSTVYVNLLTNAWWNTTRGSGNQTLADDKRNKQMTRIGETNVWYYNYGNTSTTNYVSFTDRSQDNYESFSGTTSDRVKVVYPTRPTPAGASADTAAYGFNAGTPMFVPQATQTAQPWNNAGSGDLAEYYNKGYWRNYDPVLGEEGATGYTLIVYNQTEGNSDRKVLHLVPFANSDVSGQVFKATVELEGSTGYGIKFKRDNDWVYTNTTGRLNRTGDVVVTQKEGEENWKAIYLLTTAAGKYDFIITCNGNGKLCLQATFPVAVNDYRVIYTDNATWTPENGAHTARTWFHPSRPISAVANAVDTVSFWVKKGASPEFKIQKVESITEASGAVSWTDVTSWTSCNDVTATGVYNFIFTQNGSKEISFTKKEAYTGNYYIRTDNAGSTKWDNYCTEDHKMTYSDYAAGVSHSETWRDYTHYFMKFVNKDTDGGKYKNVKFVIANDYSPCISDTLTQMTGDISVTPAYTHVNSSGEIAANANVRFMWNQVDNSLKRAYLSPAQNDGTEFLVMQGEATKLLDENGNALLNSANEGDAGYNHKAPNNAIQFVDRENWMYEAKVQAMPGAYIKLYAKYDNGYFYFYGTNDATFDSSHALQLITGSGSTAQLIRVIYDFKTDRLIAAWLPTNAEIDAEKPIDADVMIIRDHQGSGQQINLTGSGTITEVKNVYGVMRFNRWTLNNKSTVNTGTTENPVHAVLPVEDQKSQYERFNYFISFPFDVKVGEIFGFGQIGRHWRIYYYDGKGRAEEGFFADKRTDNWRLVADTEDELKANEGYLLQLNYVRMADDNTSTWPQKNMNEVELYFPAKANITAIDLADVVIPALGDDYRCTIDLSAAHGGNQEANRTIKDSYWRCIGVPGFTTKVESAGSWTNFNWKADANNVPYLYEWHMDDNRLGVVSANSFTFEPMHAYLIQNGNSFTWTSVAKPIISAVVARKMQNDDGYYEFNLEVSANDKMLDRTYVRLTDKEGITTEFDFGQDLSKEMSDSYNLYTKVGYERLAANNLPLPQQTTVIPVGLTVTADGTYTFSMPEGTYGKAVTLIDNVTDERTNLGLFDYTVTLTAGDYDGRFLLEIPAINNAATGVEQVASDRYSDVRKVLIDGILYIVKGDKVFDARGAMIK